MVNLDVLHLQLLEVAILPSLKELPPVVLPVFRGIALVDQLFQRLHIGVTRGVEEERDGDPILLRVHGHSMLGALVPIIAPNLSHYQHPNGLSYLLLPPSLDNS